LKRFGYPRVWGQKEVKTRKKEEKKIIQTRGQIFAIINNMDLIASLG
jgi:hypothetical protein